MTKPPIDNLDKFINLIDYSFMNELSSDPQATKDGIDFRPREVFSGHYVPVRPSPISNPQYISHSQAFFKELGLSECLAQNEGLKKIFSGDLSQVNEPMKKFGWSTGYALSIYGMEYTSQCPFKTGNGYGDGRAISVFEGVFNNKRWEFQLKGGGPTPYCRGADGRAVLRSSVREFLAQEFMNALGIKTSRSFTLFVSHTDKVLRPWYSENSQNFDPDVMTENYVAISTRVAPSFLRVGQIELFFRRVKNKDHPNAYDELKMIVKHLIAREYKDEIDQSLSFEKQVLSLAKTFRSRLITLVAHWLRVGYCQGNFNSDNCAAGGFTLDYGPFGFCEKFAPAFQPWTGGGRHFSFFNQPAAAEVNFQSFCRSLRPLLKEGSQESKDLDKILEEFEDQMRVELETMWCKKLGFKNFNQEIFQELIFLMIETNVDYTLFFRELSHIPKDITPLKKSFYKETSEEIESQWERWLEKWHQTLKEENNLPLSELSQAMLKTNPKYTWREWLIVPAYKKAESGDYSLIKELQKVLNNPYDEQSPEIENKYYTLRPKEFSKIGGISHYSCSS